MANAKDRRRERRRKARLAKAEKEKTKQESPTLTADVLEGPPPVSVKEALQEALAPDVEQAQEIVTQLQDLPLGGAQTWEELDSFLEAEDEADEVRQASYEFEGMLSNILDDDGKSLQEKGAAIAALANGLSDRSEEEEEKESGWIDRVRDLLGLKAEMTAASINDLPDSAFAYIEPGGEKDEDGKTTPRGLRHYPIHDAAHVRNALARAQQQINRGGKSGEIARKALPKIRAAAQRMNIGKPAKDYGTGFEVFKDARDGWRWFGWVSNKFRDRDEEIITEAAHKEFVEWVDKDPKRRMPQLWAWHTKSTSHRHRWDWLDYADGFLMGSGALTEKEAESLQRIGSTYDLGMSHGFYPMAKDPADHLITQYRTFEGSYLPVEYAANPWTDIVAVEKEADPMGLTPEKRKFLADLAGEEFVAEIETETETKADDLEKAGVDYKASEEEAPDTKELAEALAKQLGMDELGEFLGGLQKSVEGLQATVTDLKKSDDEKVAEQLRPRVDVEASIPIWKRRLSQSEETAVDEEKDETPEPHWIAEVIGVRDNDRGSVPR